MRGSEDGETNEGNHALSFGAGLWLLALAAPGDRVFAVGGAQLLRAPTAAAPLVRPLREGDELIEVDPPEQQFVLSRAPVGWHPVQTVDVPSQRTFAGWVDDRHLDPRIPLPARRIAVLHQFADRALEELEARQKPFRDLRDQIYAWRAKADAPQVPAPTAEAATAQVRQLSDRLAAFMETEVTPRALDLEDLLSELKELEDPRASRVAARLGKAAQVFKP